MARIYKELPAPVVSMLMEHCAPTTSDLRTIGAKHAARTLLRLSTQAGEPHDALTRQARVLLWLMMRGAVVQAEFGGRYARAGTYPQRDLSHFNTHAGVIMQRGEVAWIRGTPTPTNEIISMQRVVTSNGLNANTRFAVWCGGTLEEIVPHVDDSNVETGVRSLLTLLAQTDDESAMDAFLARWTLALLRRMETTLAIGMLERSVWMTHVDTRSARMEAHCTAWMKVLSK